MTSDAFNKVLIETKSYHNMSAANLFWLDNPYSAEYEQVVSETNSLDEKIGVFSDGVDCILYPKKFNEEILSLLSSYWPVEQDVKSE